MKDSLKELLKYLPQILNILPSIAKYLPVLFILAGLGLAAYYLSINYKDPYVCVNNEIYEQINITSNVYKFKGGYCVSESDLKK
jgi:hypothetical protein